MLLALSTDAALADRRVALVVGNSAYENVAKLPNPARDANSVAQMFKDAGFETVIMQQDVGNLEFKRAIRRFEDASVDAEIAVVFYAGHGIEVGGTSYLIPVDARLASDRDARDEAISLERLVESVESTSAVKRLRLIILDSCRDNPFIKNMQRQRQAALRSISSGLGIVEPSGTDTLVAYAAKAGSTAEDGDGDHSPFTTALLHSLTVPGLDIRLAFGRVRDEVMKITGKRQEPFVYGSLGGGNIALVAAPAAPKEDTSRVKADYDLVAQIGKAKAWEVFINTYKTGFYVELAKAQLEELTKLASLEMPVLPSSPSTPKPTSEEAKAWSRIENSSDPAAFQKFINLYPNSPLALNAQQHLEILQSAAQEREKKAQADRAAAQQRAEDERRAKEAKAAQQAAQQKADREAAQKRAEEERLAKAAEAERQKAEREATLKRAEDERRAKAAITEQQKAELQAALKREEAERRVKAAEAEKQKAEQKAAQQRADDERRAKAAEAEKQKAEQLAAQQGAENERRAKAAEAEKQKTEQLAALKRDEDDRRAKAAEADKRNAPAANTPEMIASAQKELSRIGCFSGKSDGVLNDATKAAVTRYLSREGRAATPVAVTDSLVSELSKQKPRTCPLVCSSGQVSDGDSCVVASPKAVKPAKVARPREPVEEKRVAAKPRPAPAAKPQVSQSAAAPHAAAHGMIGVGF